MSKALNPRNFKGKSYVESDIAIALNQGSGNNSTSVPVIEAIIQQFPPSKKLEEVESEI